MSPSLPRAARLPINRCNLAAIFPGSLERPEDAGFNPAWQYRRARASYLKVLRGWAFDADGREGAVLKGWVESRFDLLTRHHGGPIRNFSCPAYWHYLEQRSGGLYEVGYSR